MLVLSFQCLINQHFTVSPLNSNNATPTTDLRLLNDKVFSLQLDLWLLPTLLAAFTFKAALDFRIQALWVCLFSSIFLLTHAPD